MNFYQKSILQIRQSQPPNYHQVEQIMMARQFMDRHFTETINLDTVSRAACCSKFHFIRLFKRYYGLTPHRYLTDLRIRAARQLLASGTSVEATCFSLGFESSTSFTNLFKSYTGQTPSAFQRNKQLSIAN